MHQKFILYLIIHQFTNLLKKTSPTITHSLFQLSFTEIFPGWYSLKIVKRMNSGFHDTISVELYKLSSVLTLG